METPHEKLGAEFEELVATLKEEVGVFISILIRDKGLTTGHQQIALACAMSDAVVFLVRSLMGGEHWGAFLREALEESIQMQLAEENADSLITGVKRKAGYKPKFSDK